MLLHLTYKTIRALYYYVAVSEGTTLEVGIYNTGYIRGKCEKYSIVNECIQFDVCDYMSLQIKRNIANIGAICRDLNIVLLLYNKSSFKMCITHQLLCNDLVNWNANLNSSIKKFCPCYIKFIVE